MATLRIFALACIALVGASQVAAAPMDQAMEDPLMTLLSLSETSLVKMDHSLVRDSVLSCILQSTPELTGIIKDVTMAGLTISSRVRKVIEAVQICWNSDHNILCISQVIRDEYDNSEEIRDQIVSAIVRGQKLIRDWKACRKHGEPAPTVPAPTTEAPTEAPTEVPTEAPTQAPTQAPTEVPTEAPTTEPEATSTAAPAEPETTSAAPTEATTEAAPEPPATENLEEPSENFFM